MKLIILSNIDIGNGCMIRSFFRGFIKIHVLYHASKEPVYGLWLIEELGRHGYNLSPGTLYPLLSKLVKKGLLVSEKKVYAGKVRKYYVITTEGRKTLKEAKKKIKELIKEVVENSHREEAKQARSGQ